MGAPDHQRIAAEHRRAAARWPEVAVSLERFGAAIQAAVEAGASVDDLETTDLYLALGCLEGQASAIAALERDVMTAVRPSVERACRDGGSSPKDVMQWTREKLLVGDDGPPKLAQYTGRGSLTGWVRVVANVRF